MEQVKMRAGNKMQGINRKMKRRDSGKMRIGKAKNRNAQDSANNALSITQLNNT
ncbi:hypothetical protein [Plesiomonas shigelloides]|uniref:hypothetical protein n=1 Tax=Plesiomonas shigelloides TaxID=703 RepID=UPI001E340D5F|nr:hypothetical protein [Plesiomonas shigelloides]